MLRLLVENWWALELRGALTLVFGLLAFFLPIMTLGALVMVFGIYAAAEGAVLLGMAGRRKDARHVWVAAAQGIAGIAAGITAFVWPGISAVVLLFIIVTWAIATGALEIVEAVLLRQEARGGLILVLSGLLSLLFAYMLLANPAVGAVALVSVIGLYGLFFGVLEMAAGARIHRMCCVR